MIKNWYTLTCTKRVSRQKIENFGSQLDKNCERMTDFSFKTGRIEVGIFGMRKNDDKMLKSRCVLHTKKLSASERVLCTWHIVFVWRQVRLVHWGIRLLVLILQNLIRILCSRFITYSLPPLPTQLAYHVNSRLSRMSLFAYIHNINTTTFSVWDGLTVAQRAYSIIVCNGLKF